MDVAYWQLAIILSVAGIHFLVSPKAAIGVALAWTVWTLTALFHGPLIAIQLGSIWVTLLLVRNAERARTEIAEQSSTIAGQKARISKLQSALGGLDRGRANQIIQSARSNEVELVTGSRHLIELAEAIRGAKERLCIVTGWVRTNVIDDEFSELLAGALKRGVDIYVGYGWEDSSGKHSNDESVRFAEQRLQRLGEEAGRKRFRGNLRVGKFPTHEKLLIVDSKYIICGSNNWLSNRKFKNDERSVKLFDPDIARAEGNRVAEKVTRGRGVTKMPVIRYRSKKVRTSPAPIPRYVSDGESSYGYDPSKDICGVCGGDGGAKGQCYKCDGTGWA